MITSLEISGFRGIASIKVPLRPLTVLVGKNDTGKSSFLAAIQRSLGGVVDETDFRAGSPSIHVTGHMEGAGEFGLELARTRMTFGWRPTLAGQNERRARPVGAFEPRAEAISALSQGAGDAPPQLESSGAGVASLLDYLLRRDRRRFDRLVAAVRAAIPGIADITISTPDASTRDILIVADGGTELALRQLSSGARLMIFFLALAYHPTPPKTILIEEPENGVHPRRLADILSLLREITEGKHGAHAAQVIVTTHSPYLLDHVDLTRDQVLVFRREEDGRRIAEPVDAERLKVFLDEFNLGEVWFNRGEEGLIKKPA